MSTETIAGTVLEHLRALEEGLSEAGLLTKTVQPRSGVPFVKATNPNTTDLSEAIRCDRRAGDDDALWFFWSWDEPICSVDEFANAVGRIKNVVGDRR